MALKFFVYAVAVRTAYCVLSVILDSFFDDHEASGVETLKLGYQSDTRLIFLRPFTKWDSAHIISIAQNYYKRETSFAFFPLYPAQIRNACLMFSLGRFKCLEEHFVISGLLLNILFFSIASNSLLKIATGFNAPTNQVRAAFFCFCFNPAGIFFTTIYTESTFAMFGFMGIRAISSNSAISLLICYISFTCASFTRSNGILNVIFTSWQILVVLNNNLMNAKGARWFLASMQVLALFMMSIAICLPFWIHNETSRIPFCTIGNNHQFPICQQVIFEGSRNACCSTTPKYVQRFANVYAWVQRVHWNVGFLHQYQIRQLPNFILSTPIVLLASHCILYEINRAMKVYTAHRSVLAGTRDRAVCGGARVSSDVILVNWKCMWKDVTDFVGYMIMRPETPHLIHLSGEHCLKCNLRRLYHRSPSLSPLPRRHS